MAETRPAWRPPGLFTLHRYATRLDVLLLLRAERLRERGPLHAVRLERGDLLGIRFASLRGRMRLDLVPLRLLRGGQRCGHG